MPKRELEDERLSYDGVKMQLDQAEENNETCEVAVLHLMDTFDFNLDVKTCSMGMNDLLVLEWRLNKFSLRKRLKRQFL